MPRPDRPLEQIATEAREAMEQLRQGEGDLVRSMTLVVGDRETQHVNVRLPPEASDLLIEILRLLSQRRKVVLVPNDTEVTTQKAADLLNVSRPHLIDKLLGTELPYRREGSHRRIALRDVLDYRDRRDAETRAAADEATRLSEDLGLEY